MAQSPDYENYTKRIARKTMAGNLKEGEYQAIHKKNKRKARRYFRGAGVTAKNEEKAFKQADAAADKTVALKSRRKRRATK